MFKLDDDFLASVGLASLPAEEKKKMNRRDFGLNRSGSPLLLAPKCCRTKMNNYLKPRAVRSKAGPSDRTRAKSVNSIVSS